MPAGFRELTAAEILARATDPVARAVADPIPGAVLGVVTATGDRAVAAFGLAQREPGAVPMGRATWFDLASLTKVLFTTPTILRQAAQGLIRLDDPLTTAIPDLRQYDPAAAERHLTFRQCLAHQTHLPAVEPLYTYGQDPATLRAFILQRVWQAGPAVYSDINFMLLGIAIERLTGRPLSEQPLPAGLSFRPDPASCAATERCTWRGRVMRGEVHDENAFALGGAAGHAGLFGSIDGVLDAAEGLLQSREPALAGMRARQSATRTLGWEARHDGWAGGDACSEDSIGHTGFTGTGLWIDFGRGIAWALLTNRVHPTRHRETGIAALRRRVGDFIAGTVQ
jgi:CubicO group peptidase (beta-lactamase class C family)